MRVCAVVLLLFASACGDDGVPGGGGASSPPGPPCSGTCVLVGTQVQSMDSCGQAAFCFGGPQDPACRDQREVGARWSGNCVQIR